MTPAEVFFEAFFLSLMVLCGVVGICWLIYSICRLQRRNNTANETLPLQEINTAEPIEANKEDNEEVLPTEPEGRLNRSC